ncbi:5'-deoxyadenosine deaminase [Eubacterium plexicaudatum ASF492]|uniref:Amidohydrolase-related domain-containing protein n=1 Tax=Eubacterium plexicaudatum ASF492 TaxID=1235802 RepID=N2AET3_9FIRM|nr:5'-deoxyadenosine deaminase [Eubacterium plexicaudatum ASF492]
MLVIGNGKLFTRDENQAYIENGAVAIEGTRIVAVDKTENIKDTYQHAEFIDAKGGVIMPAFINTHEHIYSAMARGLSIKGYNPKGFLDILDGQWWIIDRHLTTEQTKYSAMDTMISCIRNGVTTIFDHHASFGQIKGSLFAIADAAKLCTIRSPIWEMPADVRLRWSL